MTDGKEQKKEEEKEEPKKESKKEEREERPKNLVIVARRKDKQDKEKKEDIPSLLNRSLLRVRELLDEGNETVILDSRGQNTCFAIDVATSKRLENIVSVDSVELIPIDKEVGDEGKKRMMRMSSISITLKKK